MVGYRLKCMTTHRATPAPHTFAMAGSIDLDSAAVVKLVHVENETHALREWLDEHIDSPWTSSVLLEVEASRRHPSGNRFAGSAGVVRHVRQASSRRVDVGQSRGSAPSRLASAVSHPGSEHVDLAAWRERVEAVLHQPANPQQASQRPPRADQV